MSYSEGFVVLRRIPMQTTGKAILLHVSDDVKVETKDDCTISDALDFFREHGFSVVGGWKVKHTDNYSVFITRLVKVP